MKDYVYVIWSFEHDQWWRPHCRGYTENPDEAGRYSAESAGGIVVNSILLDEVAIIEETAIKQGAPQFHPYEGRKPR